MGVINEYVYGQRSTSSMCAVKLPLCFIAAVERRRHHTPRYILYMYCLIDWMCIHTDRQNYCKGIISFNDMQRMCTSTMCI